MSCLTFDGVRKMLEGNTSDLKPPYYMQWKKVKYVDKSGIYVTGNLSDGNYFCMGVIAKNIASEQEDKGRKVDYCANDVIKFTDFKPNLKSGKYVIVIKGDIEILTPRVTSEIGNPANYSDCKQTGNFPTPKLDNTKFSHFRDVKEEKKVEKVQKKEMEENESKPIKGRKSIVTAGQALDDYDDTYMPISALNMTNSDWIILAKITKKYPPRNYSNARGEGQLMNVELSDQSGGQIQATAFGEAVDKFKDVLQEGKVYKISNCSVKVSNKRFTSVKNDYCLFINVNSVFQEAEDVRVKISDVQINVHTIKDVLNSGAGVTIDFLGVYIEDEGTRTVNTKNGEKQIRTMLFVDTSEHEDLEEGKIAGISVAMWGENPDSIEFKPGYVYAIKRCRVSEFRNCKNINANDTDEIFGVKDLNDVKEANALFSWYRNKYFGDSKPDIKELIQNFSSGSGEGGSKELKNSMATTIAQAINDNLEVFAVCGTIEFIRTDDKSCYPACPECKKKMTEDMNNGWECDKCSKTFETPVYSYLLSFKLIDPTGVLWMNCFRECGEIILGGLTAQKYHDYVQSLEGTSEASIEEIKQIGISNSYNQYKILVKHSQDTYNGELKDRYTALRIYEESYTKQNKHMMQILEKYQFQGVKASLANMKLGE